MKPIGRRGRGAGVLVLLLATLAAARVLRAPPVPGGPAADGPAPVAVELARRIFPDARTTRADAADGWTLVLGPDDRRLGAVVSTSPGMDDVTGYAGPVPVLIGVELDGVVRKLVLLENQETPGFVRRVERAGFLEHWAGRSVAEAAHLEVDAVSMATRTSSAIARSVRGRLADLRGVPIRDGGAPDAFGRFGPVGALDAAILALIAAALVLARRAGPLRNPRVFRWARLGLRAAVFGVLGLGGAVMLSLARVEGWAVTGRLAGGAGLLLLALTAVAVPLLTGRNVYCRYLCPFGAAQELGWSIAPRKRHLPPAAARRLRAVRYVLLAAVVLFILTGRGLAPEWQEPFSAFRWAAAGWAARGIAVAALLAAVLGFHRPWCTYFCSSGALLDAVRTPRKPERNKP